MDKNTLIVLGFLLLCILLSLDKKEGFVTIYTSPFEAECSEGHESCIIKTSGAGGFLCSGNPDSIHYNIINSQTSETIPQRELEGNIFSGLFNEISLDQNSPCNDSIAYLDGDNPSIEACTNSNESFILRGCSAKCMAPPAPPGYNITDPNIKIIPGPPQSEPTIHCADGYRPAKNVCFDKTNGNRTGQTRSACSSSSVHVWYADGTDAEQPVQISCNNAGNTFMPIGCEPICKSRLTNSTDYIINEGGFNGGNLRNLYDQNKELMQITSDRPAGNNPDNPEIPINIITASPYNIQESELDPINFNVTVNPGSYQGSSGGQPIQFGGEGRAYACNPNDENEERGRKYYVSGLFPNCSLENEECLNFNITYTPDEYMATDDGSRPPFNLQELRNKLPTDVFQGDISEDNLSKYKDSLYYFRGFKDSDGNYNVEGQIRCDINQDSRYGCAIIEDGVTRTPQTPMGNTTCDNDANDWSDNFTSCPGMVDNKCTSRYGVDENNNVYYSSSDPVENFFQVAINLKQVAADGEPGATLVCGLNSSGSLFCNDNPTLTNNLWRRIGPPARTFEHITVDNGKVYGVDTEHNLWYYPNTNSNQLGQQHNSGSTYKFKQIDADNNSICGVCSGDAEDFSTNRVYCSSTADNINGDWSRFPGAVNQVTVGRWMDGNIRHVYGIYGSKVYKSRIGVGDGTLVEMGGPDVGFKQIDFNGNTICGISHQNCIYCSTFSDYNSIPDWVKMKGSLKNISLGSTGS